MSAHPTCSTTIMPQSHTGTAPPRSPHHHGTLSTPPDTTHCPPSMQPHLSCLCMPIPPSVLCPPPVHCHSPIARIYQHTHPTRSLPFAHLRCCHTHTCLPSPLSHATCIWSLPCLPAMDTPLRRHDTVFTSLQYSYPPPLLHTQPIAYCSLCYIAICFVATSYHCLLRIQYRPASFSLLAVLQLLHTSLPAPPLLPAAPRLIR
ncbi:hypothetical protein B0H14DRAFT_3450696 [Mycena olivaceomarginata]|nr:hypothetical protein B0H14DRAFT_3450696 [Mycena olivaceomarginata]